MNVISLTDYIIDLEQKNNRLSMAATEAVRQANLLHLENISLRNQLGGPERLQPADGALYRDTEQLAAWGGKNV